MEDKDKRKDPIDEFMERVINDMDAKQLKSLLDKMEATLAQRKAMVEKIGAVEDGKVREALQAMSDTCGVMFDDAAQAIAGVSEENDRRIGELADQLSLAIASVGLVMAVIEQLHGKDAVNEAIRKYTREVRSRPRNLVDPPSGKNDWDKFRKGYLK